MLSQLGHHPNPKKSWFNGSAVLGWTKLDLPPHSDSIVQGSNAYIYVQVEVWNYRCVIYIYIYTIDDQKFSGYISTLFDRSVSWGQVTCLPYIYDSVVSGYILTHSNENPTVCPVSPGFELTTSCIWYRNYLLAAQTSVQPTRPSPQP